MPINGAREPDKPRQDDGENHHRKEAGEKTRRRTKLEAPTDYEQHEPKREADATPL